MVTIKETITEERMKIRRGSQVRELAKAQWEIYKADGTLHLSAEIWGRTREIGERETTTGTAVPEKLDGFKEANFKHPKLKERGTVRLIQEVKGDGKTSVLTFLEIPGETPYLWNRDINKGRAVDWAKGLCQQLGLFMEFPMRASAMEFQTKEERDYLEALAFRGKELALAPRTYKKAEEADIIITTKDAEGIQIQGIDLSGMKYNDLRKMAKEKGITLKNPTADQLREELAKVI